MSKITGSLDPTTRALLDPILAAWARPGMNNPEDPDSPTGDGAPGKLDTDTLAAAAGRDTHTASQRNHDAFTALFRSLPESGSLRTHRGLPATTIITMTLAQLEAATGVATTATVGLLPIKDALALAERSHPVLVLFDHDGRPLHLGRTRRLASADQRLALIAPDRGCNRPRCSAPPALTAVHHLTEWAKGGCTDIEDLALGCDSCHALIHDGPGGWKTGKVPTGSEFAGRTGWTAPEHIDPTRTPRVNHRQELIDHARHKAQARHDTETRQHRTRWHREQGGANPDGKGADGKGADGVP